MGHVTEWKKGETPVEFQQVYEKESCGLRWLIWDLISFGMRWGFKSALILMKCSLSSYDLILSLHLPLCVYGCASIQSFCRCKTLHAFVQFTKIVFAWKRGRSTNMIFLVWMSKGNIWSYLKVNALQVCERNNGFDDITATPCWYIWFTEFDPEYSRQFPEGTRLQGLLHFRKCLIWFQPHPTPVSRTGTWRAASVRS